MTDEQKPSGSIGENEILEELKKIRTILEPKPAPSPPKGFVNEFKQFLEQYKVLGLAVAFILGLYLGALVQALVVDLLMSIVDFAIPGVKWQNLDVGPFAVGSFLGALITFLVVAVVIFLIVKITARMGIK